MTAVRSGKAIWNQGLQFVGISGSGHGTVIDAPPEKGGLGAGPGNTELLLLALCGCTGMDVISILRKKRIDFDDFEVAAEGETSDDLPNRFTKIELVYRVWGADVSETALERSIALSKEKYCTVSNTLSGVAEISYRYEINPER
jgi:putative redox protein